MMRALFTTTLLLFSSAASARAQAQDAIDPASNPTLRDYRAKLPLLAERYSTNRKIKFRLIRYAVGTSSTTQPPEEVVNAVVEVVTDGKQMKATPLEAKPAKFKDIVQFWRQDMRFDVGLKSNQYKITDQELASVNYYNHELAKYTYFTSEPMRAGDSSGTTLWFDERGHKAAKITVVDVKQGSWKGKPCTEVRTKWDNNHGMIQLATTYLDPANDYITLATETDWKTHTDKTQYKAVREIEYAPSSEGFPLPKASRVYNELKDGRTQKVSSIEYMSYERYVPLEDEFQLEKPFKLTTPAAVAVADNPALTPPPRTRALWPWITLGVGVALGVVAVVVYKRRRATESAA